MVETFLVQCVVLMLQRQIEGAERTLVEGRELVRSMPYPYAEARILYQLGLLFEKSGQVKRAQAQLEEASAVFQPLGATKDVARTEPVRTVFKSSISLRAEGDPGAEVRP